MAITRVNDTLDIINQFLKPIRDRHEKEAADASFTESPQATPEEMEKKRKGEESTEQKTLGKEQTAEAENGGVNFEQLPPNSNALGESPTDDQGPKTLTIDEKVTEKGNIGPIREQEITQEQKMARAQNLAEGILSVLLKDQHKNNSYEKTAAGSDRFLAKLANEATDEAVKFRDNYFLGMLKWHQDVADVNAAIADGSLSKEAVDSVGGVEALLAKVAEEYPEAVLPEGMELPPDVAPSEEVAEEGTAEGVSEEDLSELATALDEAGVEPEELAKAFEDVAALQEAGVQPEELAEAVQQLAEEGGQTEKAAADIRQNRVEAVKNYLRK